MCSLNISFDRSDWDEPNKTSSEYTFACYCFITLFRRKIVSEKCTQPKYSAFTLAGHVPGAPQWPCAVANRDVNKISQTFSQYSNIQVFQPQVDSQCSNKW